MDVDKIRNGRTVECMAGGAADLLFALRMTITNELDRRYQLDHPSGYAAKWLSEMVEKIERAENACALLEIEYENALKEAEDAKGQTVQSDGSRGQQHKAIPENQYNYSA